VKTPGSDSIVVHDSDAAVDEVVHCMVLRIERKNYPRPLGDLKTKGERLTKKEIAQKQIYGMHFAETQPSGTISRLDHRVDFSNSPKASSCPSFCVSTSSLLTSFPFYFPEAGTITVLRSTHAVRSRGVGRQRDRSRKSSPR
jgi:hypothetical protein